MELRSKSSLGWTLRTRQRGDLPSDSRLATSNTIHPMIVRILLLTYRRSVLPKLKRAIAIKLIKTYGVSLAETIRLLGVLILGVA